MFLRLSSVSVNVKHKTNINVKYQIGHWQNMQAKWEKILSIASQRINLEQQIFIKLY